MQEQPLSRNIYLFKVLNYGIHLMAILNVQKTSICFNKCIKRKSLGFTRVKIHHSLSPVGNRGRIVLLYPLADRKRRENGVTRLQ